MTQDQYKMIRECIEARIIAVDKIIREKGNAIDTTYWQESKRQAIECLGEFDDLCANVYDLRMVDKGPYISV